MILRLFLKKSNNYILFIDKFDNFSTKIEKTKTALTILNKANYEEKVKNAKIMKSHQI